MTKTLKPGSPAPRSGQYQQIGPRGGAGAERTAVRGKPLPPTPKTGMAYRLALSEQMHCLASRAGRR